MNFSYKIWLFLSVECFRFSYKSNTQVSNKQKKFMNFYVCSKQRTRVQPFASNFATKLKLRFQMDLNVELRLWAQWVFWVLYCIHTRDGIADVWEASMWRAGAYTPKLQQSTFICEQCSFICSVGRSVVWMPFTACVCGACVCMLSMVQQRSPVDRSQFERKQNRWFCCGDTFLFPTIMILCMATIHVICLPLFLCGFFFCFIHYT